MVGTAPGGAGGVASVIAAYETHGLFARWPVVVITSHVVAGKCRKLQVFLRALMQFVALLMRGRVELVHLHTSADASFWRKTCFAVIAFLGRKPVLLHIHSGLFEEFYEQRCGPVRRRLVR